MHIIAYISDFQDIDSDINFILSDINEKSKRNNQCAGITGVLYLHKNIFLQIIEGSHDSLEGLMARLKTDVRHKNITRIIDEEALERSADNWSIDPFSLNFFNLSDGEHIDLRELTKAGVLKIYQNSKTNNLKVQS
jgi:hypothetical protein